ncbi:MBF transcription factor complex subunit Res2 [Schizosaccharomyces japonicus yFS275]|uniref:MBF transcription factor complex subunit Res2 n=1 Tax=Schizosaccharomyces japonicus (strain yFS275 / FY16936) TaxID=402676 RepID=B6JX59_SCHJY|nr:MBF transcription factor complex subunit Res2 [Schizosaccharomyces japonicus yFS275]EEB05960.1 MBF transcription factor complex subunit Res2 [Schizosaccharomyces japonicus yFS275]
MPPRNPGIHTATYSGVEVYECLIKGVSVMRRRHDSWLNATQILKVADFDKPQRTRILEKEVQKGHHEKVQGGYGKYQGTWVPFKRGLELAVQFKVDAVMSPILEFDVNGEEPPALKRSSSQKSRSTPGRTRQRKNGNHTSNGNLGRNSSTASSSESIAKEESNIVSSYKKLPNGAKPSAGPVSAIAAGDDDRRLSSSSIGRAQSSPKYASNSYHDVTSQSAALDTPLDKYEEALLDFFLHPEESQIPAFLYNPPSDFQVNSVIDDDGHTSLHWACSMGHVEMIKLLLRANADIGVCNRLNQTPLMRSVIFTNNYDCKAFNQVLDMLQSTLYTVDVYGQSVLHHIALATATPSKLRAAQYYLDCVLEKLTSMQSVNNVLRLINLQDTNGDTAILICARNGAVSCVNALLSYNANPNLLNRQQHSAAEFIAELEKKTDNNVAPPCSSSPPSRPFTFSAPSINNTFGTSQAFGKAIPSISAKFAQLAETYNAQLLEKDEDLVRATKLKQETQRELEQTQRELESLRKNVPNFGVLIEREIDDVKNRCAKEKQNLVMLLESRQAVLLKETLDVQPRLQSANGNTEQDPQHVEVLRERLRMLQRNRSNLTLSMIKLYEGLGIDDTVNSYRRLIATSCGMNVEELDLTILDAVEEALTQETKG